MVTILNLILAALCGQTITNPVTDLAKLQPVPKIAVPDKLPDDWWNNIGLLVQLVRVTGAITVQFNDPPQRWARARAAIAMARWELGDPSRGTIAIAFSPFHCPNGKLNGLCIRRTNGVPDMHPIDWPDRKAYRRAWERQCRMMAQLAGGIPVLILFDYEYGVPGDVERCRVLRSMLEEFYRDVKVNMPGAKVLWYRSHHWDYHGHPVGWKHRPAVPPGVPSDYGNAEWFWPLDHLGLVGAVEHAYLQDIRKPLSVVITLGCGYVPKEVWGGKAWKCPQEYDVMLSWRLGQELFASNANRDPGRWAPALVGVKLIWIEQFRDAPWEHVLAFLGGAQQ